VIVDEDDDLFTGLDDIGKRRRIEGLLQGLA
jgi:hypothetical protein